MDNDEIIKTIKKGLKETLNRPVKFEKYKVFFPECWYEIPEVIEYCKHQQYDTDFFCSIKGELYILNKKGKLVEYKKENNYE